ncbi:CBS domain-containing protein [Pelomicrobium methylotrophicum]|uniref:CBS domain-containing protein n=1 Tax=Pelomicrobium methylotrophicum TaxID=2602750 RepID=A0A5C7EM11_9PROT|nr:CBS domain-containing protein [Pelomicrobium methylotrophicum]TXF13429.1 CBS domain-containing protein [Pelomicrobium methylotrophicum]
MKTVSQLLEAKGHTVLTIPPDATVQEAMKRMAENNVGALIVIAEGRPVGIVSERDITRKLFLLEKLPRHILVKEVMSTPVVYVRPDQTNEDCMALMTDKRVRHLPVMDGGRLIGIISIGDLVKDIISEQQFIIRQLENYIMG